jgi:hypothetical protein
MKLRISAVLLATVGLVHSVEIMGEEYPNVQLVKDERGPGMPFLHKPIKALLGKQLLN